MRSVAVRRRARRALADLDRRVRRSGSARPARAALGTAALRRTEAWIHDTADGHAEYRRAIGPADDEITAVCVSKRPEHLGVMVDALARQRDVDVFVVFVATSSDFDLEAVDGVLANAAIAGHRVIDPPFETTLGAGLNLGLGAAPTRFVAKIDDDDQYGPHYLADALRAHSFAGAAVVGKHSYYADVASTGGRYLRFAGNDFRYSGTLAGGTFVIDRERTGDLEFPNVSIGEDRAFLEACHRRRESTFSADRFNFVQWRGESNTWKISDEEFISGCRLVDPLDPDHVVDR